MISAASIIANGVASARIASPCFVRPAGAGRLATREHGSARPTYFQPPDDQSSGLRGALYSVATPLSGSPVFARRLRSAAVSYVRSDRPLSHGGPESEGQIGPADERRRRTGHGAS